MDMHKTYKDKRGSESTNDQKLKQLADEDLPDPGIKPRSPALQADSLPAEPQGKPRMKEREGENSQTYGHDEPRCGAHQGTGKNWWQTGFRFTCQLE